MNNENWLHAFFLSIVTQCDGHSHTSVMADDCFNVHSTKCYIQRQTNVVIQTHTYTLSHARTHPQQSTAGALFLSSQAHIHSLSQASARGQQRLHTYTIISLGQGLLALSCRLRTALAESTAVRNLRSVSDDNLPESGGLIAL